MSFCVFVYNFVSLFWLLWVSVALCPFSSGCEQGFPLVASHGLLFAVASLAVEHGLQGVWASEAAARGLSPRGSWLWTAGSAAAVPGPSCSVPCGIFLDQGSNLCPLQWQEDSLPLDHQGSPVVIIFSRL